MKSLSFIILYLFFSVLLTGCGNVEMPESTIINNVEIKSLAFVKQGIGLVGINGIATNLSDENIQTLLISFSVIDVEGIKVSDANALLQNLSPKQSARFTALATGVLGRTFRIGKVEINNVTNVAKNKQINDIINNTQNVGYVGIFYEGNEITNVTQNSPAYNAGVKSGDVICKINGEDISGWSSLAIARAIIGPKGEKLSFTVVRDEENIDFEIMRE